MKFCDTLLLVGGPESDRPMLREIFQNDYNLLEAYGIEQGLFLLEQNQACIAAVIVDRPPPKHDGDSFLREAIQRKLIGDIPMLALITPTGTGQLETLAFSLGASDVIFRSSPPAIMRRRVQIMVDLYLNRQHLLSALEQQAETIRRSNEVMVDALSSIIEYRSAESGSHTLRIRRFTEILLEEVARSCPEYELSREQINIIASAAALHDIGKISIPDRILNKPGKLTEEEMAVMRSHTVNGANMIQALSGAASEEYLRYAYNICRFHHERWDGSGYPDGLMEDHIPICAQVVGLADVFDALTTDRTYKDAIPGAMAVNMILNGECGEFSPALLVCFKHTVPQLIDLAEEYATGRSPKDDAITLPLPSPRLQDHEIGSLQMSQLKYQALLHYVKASVAEIDLDHGVFHVVYNPFPNFQPILTLFPLEQTLNAAALNNVHPDDMELALHEYRFLMGDFFRQGLRKHSFSHRIFSPAFQEYRTYQVTILRLDVNDRSRRKAILIWQPVIPLPSPTSPHACTTVQDRKASYLLTSNVICRHNDLQFTIVFGNDRLIDLLGYTGEEIKTLFHNHFLELILPEDRAAFHSTLASQLKAGTQTELEYRVRHKDGRIIWIMERGCVVTDDEENEYFYGALSDNSRSHEIQAELMETVLRNQLIIDQSDDIIFDWDLSQDKVDLSPNWKTIFGYDPTIILRSDMLPLSRIHPDDIPAVSDLGRSIRSCGPIRETEFRIADSRNRYIWFRLRLTPVADSRGRPRRAVGTMTNIDSSKRTYLELQNQAQQDPLTSLLNKAAAQEAVRAYLSRSDMRSCALLMIDLDNFKSVNDRFGHLFGDTVLTRTAQTIRRLFRGNDILGRVGGDEFMVLMKDVGNEELVRDRCSLLLSELESLFLAESESCEVTCSIGIALCPEHGTAFQELFQHADQALYRSKQNGKHCYTMYQEDLNLLDMSIRSVVSTPIDSNELPGLANEGLVRAVFRLLAHSRDLNNSIQEVLALVGRRTNVSRVYIFENNDANTHCSNTFEWCNEGISPEIDNLQNISYETDIPGWENNYDENGILFCPDIAQLAPEPRAILEPQGVKSLLHCAIYEKGVFRGYIGLDECASHRIWTKEQVDILVFLSEVVASFLLKKRTQERADAMAANLHSLLETWRSWMYVIDPATHQLLYINSKTRETLPDLRLGDLCYRSIMSRSTPCEDCPMSKMAGSPFASSRLVSHRLQATVIAEASSVLWNKAPACLITCREPDPA